MGVATAVMAGGPNTLFWMIVAACFSMSTKYAEGLLAVKFRDHDPETGHSLGGPFKYIEKGMGPRWKWLAKLFAFFGVLAGIMGIGTITQVSGITAAAKTLFDPNLEHVAFAFKDIEYSWATVISAIVVAVSVALVLIGGIKRIASVTTVIVPFMAIAYVLICISILVYNGDKIPGALALIVKSAFGLKAAAGGALGAMMVAMQKGVARGIFSNESGLESTPMLRSGYVFPAADADPARRPDPVGADGAGQRPPLAGWSGAPPLTGRQSTAHDTATGAAKDGQLFLVRALPAGLTLRVTVTMSPALHECAGARLEGLAGEPLDARIGARRLSGTFGRALCTFSEARFLAPAEPVDRKSTV